jgi:energy-coupling factor transporter ATP-binding protein EcfA2
MSIIVKLRSPHVLKRMLILLLQLLHYCHCCCHDCSYGSKELTSVVGWVPQEPALLPMTVADNIAYGLQQHEVTRQDIEYAATEVRNAYYHCCDRLFIGNSVVYSVILLL